MILFLVTKHNSDHVIPVYAFQYYKPDKIQTVFCVLILPFYKNKFIYYKRKEL